MKLHRLCDLGDIKADETFRAPPWGMLLFPLILLLICGGLAWGILELQFPPFLWGAVAILVPMIPVVFCVNFLPTLRPTNWVIKVDDRRLYLMLRNYRNQHHPEDGPVVASFEFAEIKSLGKNIEKFAVPRRNNGTTYWTEKRLEIRLHAPVSAEFLKALADEREPQTLPAGGRSHRYPTQVSAADSVIRVLWNGRSDVVVPSLDFSLEILSDMIKIHPEQVHDQGDLAHLDDDEFCRYISDMYASGNRIAAIALVRNRRGLSLLEAKQFVEGLAAS